MKALSLSQPWCWAVLHAGKHVENRSWQPPIAMIDQQIAIHAAKSWDDKAVYMSAATLTPLTPVGYLLGHGIDTFPSRRASYDESALVGLATIDRIVTTADTLAEDQKRWFFGPFGWVLKNVLALPRPIACAGKQGLWNVPEDVLGQIREQAAA